MSDFGMFEADEAAQAQPRLAARTASRKLEAALDEVRSKFGRFLLGATGIDEFGDRWHYSKADIRKTVEPYVFPNTGTMRRIQNAMKADWKLAHPYKLAEDRDAPIQDLDETFSPSSGNLIPEGNFEGYKDGVDQGGPEKVQRDFTPGGDSGSDKHARRHDAGAHDLFNDSGEVNNPHAVNPWTGDNTSKGLLEVFIDAPPSTPKHQANREAAMLVADIYTDFAQANGLRVASLDTLDRYAATGIHEADYRLLESMIVATAAKDCDCEGDCDCDDSDDDDDSEPKSDSGPESHPEPDSDDEGGEPDGDEDDSDGGDAPDFGGSDDEGGEDFGGDTGGGEQYTVPEHAPELDPQMQAEIPQDDADGAAPIPPEVIDSLLGLPEGTIEQLLLEEVERGAGAGDQFGGAPQGGGDDFLGGAGDGAEQAPPPRQARRRRAAAEDDYRAQHRGVPTKKLIKRYRNGDDDLFEELHYRAEENDRDAAREVLNDYNVDDDDWTYRDGYDGDGYMDGRDDPRPPHVKDSRRRTAAPDESESAMMDRQKRQQRESIDTKFGPRQEAKPNIRDLYHRAKNGDSGAYATLRGLWKQRGWTASRAARTFWAAEDEQSGGDQGGGQQAPQQPDPAAMGGGMGADPSMMGQGMMPPPGSQAVQPPAPPQPLEDQPAEDALLDTANQAIMQMIDRETQEYQQIIDPLSQALQAIQFAQQVEQSEHPMDVTPPQGTVNVDPSQAPGGAQNPMQPTARKRTANKRAVLRNAARLIAGRYGLSHGGERMLVEAMGRRNYEHVREALQLLPPEHLSRPEHRAAVRHIGEMFAADNPRFNQDAWMKSVLGSAPGSRLPFESARREAGENNSPTPTLDAFEFLNEKPRIDDNIAVTDLPKMKGASAKQDAISRFERWTRWRQQNGLVVPGGDGGIHDFMQKTRNPGKAKVGDEASAILHRSQGLEPDAPKVPKAHPMKAVNPTLKKPRAPKAASSFFFGDPVEDAGGAPSTLHCSRCGHSEPGGHDLPDGSSNLCPHCAPAAMMDYQFYGHPSERLSDEFRQNPDSGYGNALFKELEHRAGMGDHDAARTVIDEVKARGPRGNSREMDGPGEWESVVSDAIKNPGDWEGDGGLLGRGPSRPSVPSEEYQLPDEADPRLNKHLLSNRQASFFTRRVPGWRWDDHLNGYISKEGRAFTCSCGQKVAAPSYKTCDCGRIWNVYAIGGQHHLGSDTADMFVAREIPVRDNVIMANRRMAGVEDFGDWAEDHAGDGFWRNFGREYYGEEYPEVNPADYIPDEHPHESIDDVMRMYRKWDPDGDVDPDDPRIKGASRLAAKRRPSDLVCPNGDCGTVFPGDFNYDEDEDEGNFACPNCGSQSDYDVKEFPTKKLVREHDKSDPDTRYGWALLEELHDRAARDNDVVAAGQVLNDPDVWDYGTEDADPAEVVRDLLENGPRAPKGYNPHWTYETGRRDLFDPPVVRDPFDMDAPQADPDEHLDPDDPRIKGAALLFARLAGSGMSFDDVMKHIDDVLAEGEGHSLHNFPGISKNVPNSGLIDMPRIGIDEPNRLGPRPPRRFSPTSFSGSNGPVHPDIAGYTYNGENYEPHNLIDHMISIGELSPGAAQMPVEDALQAHADYNGIDRYDEGTYDSSEHPKAIFHDQLDPEHDADWYSGFQKHCDSCGDRFPQHELSSTWDDPDRELCPDCFDEENEDDDDRRYSSLDRAEAAWKKHLADWTKYDDGEDPVVKAYGKSKPPSTTIPKQPRDWAKRLPDGTWNGPAIPRKRK